MNPGASSSQPEPSARQDPPPPSDPALHAAGRPLRPGKTIRAAVRAAWDALGLVCLSSLTLFALALVPVTILARFGFVAHAPARLAGWCAAMFAALVVLPPIYAGVCWLADTCLEHDEPGYQDIWVGAKRLFWRALALGAIDAAVKLLLLSNLVFYLSRGTFFFLLLSVLFLYLYAFWLMQLLYHFPLLVAAERGHLRREGEGRTSLSTILRNALILAIASPGYSFALVALLVALAIPCLLSGAGMALIYPGFAAFLTMQATRDQLVRFGHLPPPPDPDEPVPDERWRVR